MTTPSSGTSHPIEKTVAYASTDSQHRVRLVWIEDPHTGLSLAKERRPESVIVSEPGAT